MAFTKTNSTVTAILIRQLTGLRPVTSMILREVAGDEPQRNQFIMERVKEHIRDHCDKFVEFRNADWYVDVIGDEETHVIKSEQIDMVGLFVGYN